jgi:hypothetical protein
MYELREKEKHVPENFLTLTKDAGIYRDIANIIASYHTSAPGFLSQVAEQELSILETKQASSMSVTPSLDDANTKRARTLHTLLHNESLHSFYTLLPKDEETRKLVINRSSTNDPNTGGLVFTAFLRFFSKTSYRSQSQMDCNIIKNLLKMGASPNEAWKSSLLSTLITPLWCAMAYSNLELLKLLLLYKADVDQEVVGRLLSKEGSEDKSVSITSPVVIQMAFYPFTDQPDLKKMKEETSSPESVKIMQEIILRLVAQGARLDKLEEIVEQHKSSAAINESNLQFMRGLIAESKSKAENARKLNHGFNLFSPLPPLYLTSCVAGARLLKNVAEQATASQREKRRLDEGSDREMIKKNKSRPALSMHEL